MNNTSRKVCRYCGCETDISTSKCESCGSSNFQNVERMAVPNQPNNQSNQRPGFFASQSQAARPAEKKNKYSLLIAAVAVVAVVIIIITIIASLGGGSDTSMHSLEGTIVTDWFKMTVHEGKIIRTKNSYCGLEAPSSGYERVLVDITLDNYLYEEDLDINIADDFYLEAGSSKFPAKNSGGNYSIFDRLSIDGMFYGRFMVSTKKQLHGYIAFDVPATAKNLRFVYIEYNFEGDERTTIKHYYKIDLEYETPKIPTGAAQDFYNKAYNAGYVLEIINDYDGYETFWIGAHKYVDESSKGITKKPAPVYWIDFTKDISERNAGIEYNNYVEKVKRIGGTAQTESSGSSYKYQCNTSSTKFGIAFQIGLYNYLVESSPIEYKDEILNFLDGLSLKIS